MPRPRIKRHVYGLPSYSAFGPKGTRNTDIVIMSIEEYETIRLIDDMNLNQAQCAEEMGIGRTTAQRIYNNARSKIASCLVYGKTLQFEGGDYTIKGQGRGRGNHGYGKGRNSRLKD